ncbi:tyrosine-type recombinase/integrase [Vibrio coralliilyticus]|uniref:tyrosine-type recombinase/integrase n=1 Tax=Vibrio coralliilyticus TaxID=190893 RepID=UPI0039171EFB
MTDLTPFPPLEHLEPDEFADLVRKAIKRDPQAGAHPAIQSAISHFQDEFVRRQGEWQPATLQRLRNAWNVFVRWCIQQGIPALPARHQDVERYLIERCNELHRNTLKVHLWAIGKTHVISGLPNPCAHRYVKAQMAQITHQKVRERERIEQAPAFRESDLDRLTELWSATRSVTQQRDLMIVSLAYETLLRKNNLEQMKVGDIEFCQDGSALITIPFSKTNHSGRDDVRWISPQVASQVHAYLQLPNIDADPQCFLLQRVKRSGKAIDPESHNALNGHHPVSEKLISRVFERAWKALNHETGPRYTGHSARVGAAQDLLQEGYSTLQVMQAGGWSSEKMVLRYGRHLHAHTSAMAQKRRRS